MTGKKKRQETLTLERLRAVLHYDPTTGVFTHTGLRRPAGTVAGCVHTNRADRPRWQIVIDTVHYKAHRLAWLYVYGKWPEGLLDHINGDALDNRIANLREATSAQNMANSIHPKGATGLRGVCYYRNAYMAQISHRGQSLYLGRFKTAEQAHAAWCAAAKQLRGDFTKTD